MVRFLGQAVGAVKSWVLLVAIFFNLLLVAGAILFESSSVWLLIPLAAVVILIFGIIGGVTRDARGIKKYLSAVHKDELVDWNHLVAGPLNGLHDTFIDVFKSHQRRNAEYKDAVKEMDIHRLNWQRMQKRFQRVRPTNQVPPHLVRQQLLKLATVLMILAVV